MRLAGVEAARGVAALLVVLVHTGNILGGPRYYGTVAFDGLFVFARAGVDFFFVLSGFIITYVHAADVGRPNRVVNYARRRFIRIYPTYWAVSAILFAILLVSPTPERQERDPVFVVWSFLLLPSLDGPMLGPGWSLRHELLFYAIFALSLFHRRLGQAALLAWAGGTLWNLAVSTITAKPWFGGLWNDLVFRVFNIQFFFGIAVAVLIARRVSWRPNLVLAAGILLFFATGLLDSWGPAMPPEWPPKHLAYASGSALALYGLVAAERKEQLRVPRFLVMLGQSSYSLYLTHIITAMFGAFALREARALAWIPLNVAFIGLVIASVAAALVFHRLVEHPLLRYFGRLGERRPTFAFQRGDAICNRASNGE